MDLHCNFSIFYGWYDERHNQWENKNPKIENVYDSPNRHIDIKINEFEYFGFILSDKLSLDFPINFNKFTLNGETIVNGNKYHYYRLINIDPYTNKYTIKAKLNNNVVGTITIHIVKSPLNDHDLKKIIFDLENFESGLTRDYFKLNGYLSPYYFNYNYKANDITLINLSDQSNKLINDFTRIIRNPSVSLNKKYMMSKSYHNIDNKTLKLNNEYYTSIGFEEPYSFIRCLGYNNEENKWIKRILYKLLTMSNDGINIFKNKLTNISKKLYKYKLNDYYNNPKSEINYKINRYKNKYKLYTRVIKRLINLYNYLNYKNNSTFFKYVGIHIHYFPKKLLLSPVYNSIYMIYQNLFKNKLSYNNKINRNMYLSMPTWLLYEMWAYIQVIKLLKKLGYKQGKRPNKNLYYIRDNTSFHLFRKNVHINVVYNESISKDNKTAPLFIDNNHCKPDIRIDIYVHKTYVGSILLDAKCEYSDKIIGSKSQFLSYKYYSRSFKLRLNNRAINSMSNNLPILRNRVLSPININPVKDVFVLYPKNSSLDHKFISYINYQVLTPFMKNDSKQNFINKLNKYINIYTKTYKYLI